MSSATSLTPAIALLSAGVCGLVIGRFAHINSIVAFFILGACIGPHGLALIDSHDPTIHLLAEIGVCFLLFDVGLHLSLRDLALRWRNFIGIGFAQWLSAMVVVACAALLFGVPLSQAWVIGSILALSSTALVLKILSDNHDEGSPVGRRATEILVFQDIIAIILIVVFTGHSGESSPLAAVSTSIAKVGLAAIVMIFLGKVALKPLFALMISLKNDEVFTAVALLLVLLSSWATQALGLSLALGAFLGGLALSESSYSYLVRGEVAPFRSLLLSLFFLSIGFSLDIAALWSQITLIVALTFGFVALKYLSNYVAMRVSGQENRTAYLISGLLAQSSEFGFVLIGTALNSELIQHETAVILASVTGLSLAFTPFVAAIGCYFSRCSCSVESEGEAQNNDPREIIVVRIDEFGRQLVGLLESEGIPYRAHDMDHDRLSYAQSRGLNVYFSDLNRPRTLGRVSLGKALAVVCLVEERDVVTPLIEGLKKIDSNLPVFAASEQHELLEHLWTLKVTDAFTKKPESLIIIFEGILRAIGIDELRVSTAVVRARSRIFDSDAFAARPNTELGLAELSGAVG